MSGPNAKTKKMMSALKEVARVAEVMVDGEEAQGVITDRAYHYLAHPDPKFKHMVGDYFDVDLDGFLRAKKTLMRLERLLDFPCSTSFWLKVKDLEDQLTLLLHNGKLSRWYVFGAGTTPLEGELKNCIKTGEILVLEPNEAEERVTALAPVRDSLGDVVGAIEFTAIAPTAKNLEPTWN